MISAGGDSGSESGNESDSDGDGGGDGESDGDGDSPAEPQADRVDSEQTADEHRPTAAATEPLSSDSQQPAASSSEELFATGLSEPPICGEPQQPNQPEERKEAGPQSAGQQGQSAGKVRRPVQLAHADDRFC